VTTPYTRDILRLAAHVPGRVGFEEIEAPDLRSPTCGARMRVAVTLDDGRIASLSQAIEACAFGQAAAAVMAGGAIGRSGAEARAMVEALKHWFDGGERPDWPDVAMLDPVVPLIGRHGAVLLPFRALASAIEGAQ
jgi:NifU-like protein involved in Fe-S cluster formation